MDIIEEVEISTLYDYLTWIEQEKVRINNPLGNTRGLFYRGHSDKSYQLKPFAYRKNEYGHSYRKVEHHLYQEMWRSEMSAFAKDKNIFERLIRMQHHGLPTRLLDLTEDPLVALYFACKNEFSKDGQVYFFYINPADMLFSSSIPDTALVGLEKPFSVLEMGFNIAENFINYLEKRKDERDKISDFDIEYHALLDKIIAFKNFRLVQPEIEDILLIITMLQNFESWIEDFIQKWDSEFIKNDHVLRTNGAHEESTQNLRLQNFLLKFSNAIDDVKNLIVKKWSEGIGTPYVNLGSLPKFLQQFSFFYFVYPPLNNERIRRQKGAFVIYPQIESEFHTVQGFFKPVTVKIKSEAKTTILRELSNIGIIENYLFPSLNERANEITKQYRPF